MFEHFIKNLIKEIFSFLKNTSKNVYGKVSNFFLLKCLKFLKILLISKKIKKYLENF